MGVPFPLLSDAVGMMQDASRDQLPGGMVWNMVDWVPNRLGAPLRKRGGYGQSSALGANSYMQTVAYAAFTAGAQVVTIDNTGQLYNQGAGTNPGNTAFTAIKQPPVFHRQKVLIAAGDGSTGPKYYDGAAVSGTIASAPTAIYAAVYHDFSVLANSSGNVNRIWFSNPGDPTTWTTSTGGSWVDTTYPITGLAALRGMVLIFSAGAIERLRGTTPPPGTDMVLEGLSDHGCLDARSIATVGQTVIFANAEGVFLTDGATDKDLTAAGGMSEYWRTTLSSWTSSWTLSGGVYQGEYVISLMNGSTFIDCLVCDLATSRWRRYSNIKAVGFAHALGSVEELHFARRDANRVGTMSGTFAPSSGNANDGDGTAVTPIVETGLYRGWLRFHRKWIPSQGFQVWRFGYLDYDIRDGGASPSLALSYLTTPEGSSYTTLSPNPALSATTDWTRKRIPINKSANGMAFKIAQTNASTDTRVFALECEYWPKEPSGLV